MCYLTINKTVYDINHSAFIQTIVTKYMQNKNGAEN